MEAKELAVETLTNQCRDLDRKYEKLRSEYEQVKEVYSVNPTISNYKNLNTVHGQLIRCSNNLSAIQNRLIEAYWSYFGVRHWQFRLNKDKKKLERA
jgi:hypothetical protein